MPIKLFVEKTMPRGGDWMSRLRGVGVLLIIWGTANQVRMV